MYICKFCIQKFFFFFKQAESIKVFCHVYLLLQLTAVMIFTLCLYLLALLLGSEATQPDRSDNVVEDINLISDHVRELSETFKVLLNFAHALSDKEKSLNLDSIDSMNGQSELLQLCNLLEESFLTFQERFEKFLKFDSTSTSTSQDFETTETESSKSTFSEPVTEYESTVTDILIDGTLSDFTVDSNSEVCSTFGSETLVDSDSYKSTDSSSDVSAEDSTSDLEELEADQSSIYEPVSILVEATEPEELPFDETDEYNSILLDRSGFLESSISAVDLPGIRGRDYPDYEDIPETSFLCDDKKYVPGLYADFDTDCQVFHVCLHNRMETFLCPIGTTFNQRTLACDYWFNSTCSESPFYYYLNEDLPEDFNPEEVMSGDLSDMKYLESLASENTARFVPVLVKTSYYCRKNSFDQETSEFHDFSKIYGSTEDPGLPAELKALAHKVYDRLFDASDAIDKQPKMKTKQLKLNDKFSFVKADRSGDIADTEVHSEQTIVEAVSTKEPKAKLENSNFKKNQIAPVIVSKVLETAENVFNKGIMPLTKEILALSYTKRHSKGKH